MATDAENQTSTYTMILRLMSKRRTWVYVFSPRSIHSFYLLPGNSSDLYSLGTTYKLNPLLGGRPSTPPSFSGPFSGCSPWLRLFTWITILVLLAVFGKPRTSLVVEGRKITKEIVGFVLKTLLREGNFVAAVCAVSGYFALFRRNIDTD